MSEYPMGMHTDLIRAVFAPLQMLLFGPGSTFSHDNELQPSDVAGTTNTPANKRRASESKSESKPILNSSKEDEQKFTPSGINSVRIALVLTVLAIYYSIQHMRYRASYKWWHALADSSKADWHKDAKVVQDLKAYLKNLWPQFFFAIVAACLSTGYGAGLLASMGKIWFSQSKGELSTRQKERSITLGTIAALSAISAMFSVPDAILAYLEFFALCDELRAI